MTSNSFSIVFPIFGMESNGSTHPLLSWSKLCRLYIEFTSPNIVTRMGQMGGDIGMQATAATPPDSTKSLHLVVDGLPAHKNKTVKDYVASTEGRLTLHFLPG